MWTRTAELLRLFCFVGWIARSVSLQNLPYSKCSIFWRFVISHLIKLPAIECTVASVVALLLNTIKFSHFIIVAWIMSRKPTLTMRNDLISLIRFLVVQLSLRNINCAAAFISADIISNETQFATPFSMEKFIVFYDLNWFQAHYFVAAARNDERSRKISLRHPFQNEWQFDIEWVVRRR